MEDRVIEWFEKVLDDDPQHLVDLYTHLNGGQILKYNPSPLELVIIDEDNIIKEVNCWLILLSELSYYVYDGYLDDVETIFNFLLDRGEIIKQY